MAEEFPFGHIGDGRQDALGAVLAKAFGYKCCADWETTLLVQLDRIQFGMGASDAQAGAAKTCSAASEERQSSEAG